MAGSEPKRKGMPSESVAFGLEGLLRRLSLRARILSLAAINTAVVLLLTLLIIDGASGLKNAWNELLQVRASDRVFSAIESESGRLQSLIHRYFTQPNPEVLDEIERRRATLGAQIASTSKFEPSLASAAQSLGANTERLIKAFDDLRQVRTTISEIYEIEVLGTAREVSGLYAITESALRGSDSLVRPALEKSRELFSQTIVAANAYYLSLAPNSVQQAFSNIDTIEQTLPVMLDLADEMDDDDTRAEAANEIEALGKAISELEVRTLLSGEYDQREAIVTIRAEAGGVDAADFAEMLLRMYKIGRAHV